MKVDNLHIYGSAEHLAALKADYDYSARNDTRMLDENHLVVLALPSKRKKKVKDESGKERDGQAGPRAATTGKRGADRRR